MIVRTSPGVQGASSACAHVSLSPGLTSNLATLGVLLAPSINAMVHHCRAWIHKSYPSSRVYEGDQLSLKPTTLKLDILAVGRQMENVDAAHRRRDEHS